jgi:glycosyltransferase involved in cell wall biosynthesis
VGDIIEAFALALEDDPDLFLLVGGDGPLRGELEQRVEALGIESRVAFIGLLPESELPALLRAVDVYVSATAVDGTSVTLLQALAIGTTTVASGIPGNLGWLGREPRTFAYPVGDLVAFKARIVDAVGPGGARVAVESQTADIRRSCDWSRNSLALSWIMESA